MAVSDAMKLRLFNAALGLLREGALASLSEDRHPQYVLTRIWEDGALKEVLEKGQWHFASRIVSLTYDPDVDTDDETFQYAINKPDDMVRLTAFCSDGRLRCPVDYQEVGANWLCDLDTVWIKYVSNDDSYGGDTSLWPESFRLVFEAVLAQKAAAELTTSQEVKDDVDAALKKRLSDAVTLSAMAGPTKFTPVSSWGRARGGRGRFPYDRGTR